PIVHDVHQTADHIRAVEIQVRLMMVEAVPKLLLGYGIPRPIGCFEILEDDAGVLVLICGVAPHIKIPCRTAAFCASRSLKPGVVVGRVIENEFGDYTNATTVRFPKKSFEVVQCAV